MHTRFGTLCIAYSCINVALWIGLVAAALIGGAEYVVVEFVDRERERQAGCQAVRAARNSRATRPASLAALCEEIRIRWPKLLLCRLDDACACLLACSSLTSIPPAPLTPLPPHHSLRNSPEQLNFYQLLPVFGVFSFPDSVFSEYSQIRFNAAVLAFGYNSSVC